MASNTMELQAVRPAKDQLGTLVGRTMALVAGAAGFFALGAYAGRDLSYGWSWVWFIPALGLVVALNFAAERSQTLAIVVTASP